MKGLFSFIPSFGVYVLISVIALFFQSCSSPPTQEAPEEILTGRGLSPKNFELGFLEDGWFVALSDLGPDSIERLHGLPIRVLSLIRCSIDDLKSLKEFPLRGLHFYGCSGIVDVSDFAELRLKELSLEHTAVSNLQAMTNMPLSHLSLYYSPVETLSDIDSLRLRYLNIIGTKIDNLSPVQGMPLETLLIDNTPIRDLRPLQGMNLKNISFPIYQIKKGISVLRSMKSIKRISIEGRIEQFTPERFWKKYDTGELQR